MRKVLATVAVVVAVVAVVLGGVALWLRRRERRRSDVVQGSGASPWTEMPRTFTHNTVNFSPPTYSTLAEAQLACIDDPRCNAVVYSGMAGTYAPFSGAVPVPAPAHIPTEITTYLLTRN